MGRLLMVVKKWYAHMYIQITLVYVLIDRVPKRVWLQVPVMSRVGVSILMTSRRAKDGSVNGKFIQRQGSELAAERYNDLHLKSLQYDIHHC